MVIAPERSSRSALKAWVPTVVAPHLGFVCATAGATDEAAVYAACEAAMVDPTIVEPERRVAAADGRPSDWVPIANAVMDAASQGVAGVVVVHGIETVAYAAAGLSFLLAGRVEVPVVLTTWNTAPPAIESDAATNVQGAMAAASYLPPATYLAFAGLAGHRCDVFLGTRARYRHAGGRSLVSTGRQPVARIADGSILVEAPPRPPAEPWSPPALGADDRVLALRLHPGCPLDALAKSLTGIRGVVVELYPNGACPTSPGDASIGRFVTECTGRGIPVVGITHYGWGVDPAHPNMAAFTSAGGVVVRLPMESAVAKLAVALAQDGDPAAIVARQWEHR